MLGGCTSTDPEGVRPFVGPFGNLAKHLEVDVLNDSGFDFLMVLDGGFLSQSARVRRIKRRASVQSGIYDLVFKW